MQFNRQASSVSVELISIQCKQGIAVLNTFVFIKPRKTSGKRAKVCCHKLFSVCTPSFGLVLDYKEKNDIAFWIQSKTESYTRLLHRQWLIISNIRAVSMAVNLFGCSQSTWLVRAFCEDFNSGYGCFSDLTITLVSI
jgi:hypothetical protein